MILTLLETVLFTYLSACILYNLFFALAGRIVKRRPSAYAATGMHSRIAILIPAYKEDSIILSTVKSYAAQQYPADAYEVIVVADSLQPETLLQLKSHGATVIPVSFDKSTKAKSLNAAFGQMGNDYDIALICDADNILEPDFLKKINHVFWQGEDVIQAQRVAKNMDTPFAVLDAANEMIANHIYRKGANAVGLSSSVIGSGMAFEFRLIKEVMAEIEATGGFDKVLQLLVVSKGHRIYYLEEALVFDEKVENSAAFTNQRKRWMSSQFVYLAQYWKRGWQQLFKGNLNYFNLAVCQNILLPRMVLLAAVTLLTLLSLLLQPFLAIPAAWWIIIFAANCLTLVLPIPVRFFTKYLLTAMLSLPRAIFIMVGLMFRLKGANNTFIHTKHTKTDIDNPLLDVVRK